MCAAAAAAADVMTSSVTLVQDQKVGVVARRGQTATLGCIDGSMGNVCRPYICVTTTTRCDSAAVSCNDRSELNQDEQ
jgi:rRNA processing protein Gar1